MIKTSHALAVVALAASALATPAVASAQPATTAPVAQRAGTVAVAHMIPCKHRRHSAECRERHRARHDRARHDRARHDRDRHDRDRHREERGYVGESPLTGRECTGGIEVGCPD
ncbi:hypothetical protein ABGB18_39970 [Nonomuraea sp. B12E4]|uniref:hypothetical protein n=1 Tax=Nonomuraea sp. B12E4 TaxID=3153564 RepID=UPI00325CC33F